MSKMWYIVTRQCKALWGMWSGFSDRASHNIKISYEGDSFIVPMKGCSYASADKFHKDLRNYLDRIKK